MSDGLELLVGRRREAVVNLFEEIVEWHEIERKSQLRVKKINDWKCFITEDPLDTATIDLVENLTLSSICVYVMPYLRKNAEVYLTHDTRRDIKAALHKVSVLDSLLVGYGSDESDILFLQCLMPGSDFSIFFGSEQCFEIMSSKDEDITCQWSSDYSPSTDRQGEWILRRLVEVDRYNNQPDGSWQTFTWGLGEYLELHNLTLEEYQRQMGWI